MPTHHAGPPEEVRALNAFITLTRASDTVFAQLNRRATHKELTPGQFAVMEALYHLGPMTQREIGRKVLRSNANITTVVDNLERDQYIRRERGEKDRRCITVSLTDKGQALMQRVMPGHIRAVTEMFAVLDPGEQEELARLAKKLGTRLAAGSGGGC